MKRACLLATGAVLSLLVFERTQALGGHGHGGGGHTAKASHEAPKHSSSKPAPHPAPKPQSKPHTNAPHKPAPMPHGETKNNSAQSSHGHDRKIPSQTGSNPAKPNAVGSNTSSKTTSSKTNDEKTHNEHHEGHHWHHERWWHGHHLYWSADGAWVDAATGQPVVGADLAPPIAGSEAPLAGPTPAAIATRPQIHFSVDASERDSYDAAAQAAGMSRAEWIRRRLNDAARKELK